MPYLLVVILKTAAWTTGTVATALMLAAVCSWSFEGMSTRRRHALCVLLLPAIFLPDILPGMTWQALVPSCPQWLGLSCSFICCAFPLLLLPALAAPHLFDTTDALAARAMLAPWRALTCVAVPQFVRVVAPVCLFVWLRVFHTFSLPALWEIELVPNYLFAEFNTQFSFSGFFVQAGIVCGVLMAAAVTCAVLLQRRSGHHAAPDHLPLRPASTAIGLAVVAAWFSATSALPVAYWSVVMLRRWHEVAWPLVIDSWPFSIVVMAGTAVVAIAAGIVWLNVIGARLGAAVGLCAAVCGAGPVAVAVCVVLLASKVAWPPLLVDHGMVMVCALVLQYGPLAVLMCVTAHALAPWEWWDAARLLIRGRLRRSMLIELPILLPVLFTISVLVMACASKDIDTSILLVPPGRQFLPMRLHLLLHYNNAATLAAVVISFAVIATTATAAVSLTISRLVRHGLTPDR